MAASILFLALLTNNPVTLLPLAAFLLLGYASLVLVNRSRSGLQAWVLVAIVFAYVWLKRYSFLPEAMFINGPYLTLGLSYIFFRVLHVLIESGDSPGRHHIGFGAYLLYTLNFTTFVSGPIQRYYEFARDQFAFDPIALGARAIGLQLERIVRGFFKVNVLATLINVICVDAFNQISQPLPSSMKTEAVFRLAVLYPVFLYANFSGYIDIVIALARLMRVRLPENFNRPFSASSFIDFWNRWHITLSTWLKTYVYNPLLVAMMRRVSRESLYPFLGVFCFFVTFFLVGVWHGRSSEFLVFGVLQGGGVAINKLWQICLTRVLDRSGYKKLSANSVYVSFGRGLTFTWFAFTLFWFWADWKQIRLIFSSIALVQLLGVWFFIWLSATALLSLWEVLRARLLSIRNAEGPILTNRYARVIYASSFGLAAFLTTVLLNQPAPDIIYKSF
jgi:D-alanyl-lipoteichoic acid acyltransferase DltB (MBOAT superfamily)